MTRKLERNKFRRQKLRKLIDDRCQGVAANLGRMIGKDPSYINRCLYEDGKEGQRNIGDEIMDAVVDYFNFPDNSGGTCP